MELTAGEALTFLCGDGDVAGDARRMSISWAGLAEAVEPDSILYLADGSVRLRVTAVRIAECEVDTEIEVGGAVASRQGLNIPGPIDALPAVPEEDLQLLGHGESIGVDMVALSFVRSPQDIETVRDHTRLPLIAKIEKPQAVERAEEIIQAADCVMVARGDLGIELPIEQVPLVQKRLLELAGRAARPSITATQMLDSMVSSSRPTRAEVADVANAILDGTDAVMLSQETAIGAYPVEAVAMMAAVAEQAGVDRPLRALERVARASHPLRPRLHDRPQPVRRRPRAAPRRARHPDAVRPLRAAGLRAPPDGADLRALARARDGAPLRADVGRAGRLDAPSRDDRGADRRRRPAGRRARLVQAGPARGHHRRAALGAAGHDQPVPDSGPLGGAASPRGPARTTRWCRRRTRHPSCWRLSRAGRGRSRPPGGRRREVWV